jgi:hypothetical protein
MDYGALEPVYGAGRGEVTQESERADHAGCRDLGKNAAL